MNALYVTPGQSQSAFMRGFIDDAGRVVIHGIGIESQSAFMRGFIDDTAALASMAV